MSERNIEEIGAELSEEMNMDAGEVADAPDAGADGFDPFDWLMQPVHGDVQTASIENIFSPHDGGWNRLALVFESAFDGPGMPRAVHIVVAAIEIMIVAQQEGAEAAQPDDEVFGMDDPEGFDDGP